MQWDLARSSLGDSLKGSGSSLGARREIIGRRPDDLSQECRSQRQVLVGIRKVEETTFVKIQTGKPLASGRSEDNAVGNSLRVCWELAEGIGSLPELRKRVRQKKTETRRKIVGGSRNACQKLERS
ncbi:hypothetical protein BHE74_00038102 [Ensete ventricosum]|nr:hypothetical protein BHE74_00038102 [Ensete ventricosum]